MNRKKIIKTLTADLELALLTFGANISADGLSERPKLHSDCVIENTSPFAIITSSLLILTIDQSFVLFYFKRCVSMNGIDSGFFAFCDIHT